ncbi:OpgC family protein [Roseivivax sp. CAU 1761]
MSLAEPALPLGAPGMAARPAMPRPAAASRDLRLDVFRGLAMFFILFSHTPGNAFAAWLPTRFGFSDATEIFVFCSGMASALAFGATFRSRGWALGSARVLYRCWQVYWVHIALFLGLAAAMSALNASGLFAKDYVGQLNLWPFFKQAAMNLPALLTLTYVPNYFDILPMYLVILALMPVVVGLYRLHPGAALAAVLGLWAAAQGGMLALPAEPWSARHWFFNPFGWQLIFFTGFALMAGWLPVPPVDRRLVILAAVVVLASVPFAWHRAIAEFEAVREWRGEFKPLFAKSEFGPLRYLHFLALAYLAWVAAGPDGARLALPAAGGAAGRAGRVLLAMVVKVGQQSLAAFVASMALARFMGVALDLTDRQGLALAAVNLGGAALLVAAAYGAGWFKSQPWRRAKDA